MSLEQYFAPFRERIVGIDAIMKLADGSESPIVYADWTASGRLYGPTEDFMLHEIGPLVANTHTETTYTGVAMTEAYHRARRIIKEALLDDFEDAVKPVSARPAPAAPRHPGRPRP